MPIKIRTAVTPVPVKAGYRAFSRGRSKRLSRKVPAMYLHNLMLKYYCKLLLFNPNR